MPLVDLDKHRCDVCGGRVVTMLRDQTQVAEDEWAYGEEQFFCGRHDRPRRATFLDGRTEDLVLDSWDENEEAS